MMMLYSAHHAHVSYLLPRKIAVAELLHARKMNANKRMERERDTRTTDLEYLSVLLNFFFLKNRKYA